LAKFSQVDAYDWLAVALIKKVPPYFLYHKFHFNSYLVPISSDIKIEKI